MKHHSVTFLECALKKWILSLLWQWDKWVNNKFPDVLTVQHWMCSHKTFDTFAIWTFLYFSENVFCLGCNFRTIVPWGCTISTCQFYIESMNALCNLSNSSPPSHVSVKHIYFLLQLLINWLETRELLLIISERSQPLGWGVQWEFHYTLPSSIYHLSILIKQTT